MSGCLAGLDGDSFLRNAAKWWLGKENNPAVTRVFYCARENHERCPSNQQTTETSLISSSNVHGDGCGISKCRSLFLCLSCGICYCSNHVKPHNDHWRNRNGNLNGKEEHSLFFTVSPKGEPVVMSADTTEKMANAAVKLHAAQAENGPTIRELRDAPISFSGGRVYGFVLCTACGMHYIKLPARGARNSSGILVATLAYRIAAFLWGFRSGITVVDRPEKGLSNGTYPRTASCHAAADVKAVGNFNARHTATESNKGSFSRSLASFQPQFTKADVKTLMEARIAGFENRGNTCYFNAVLQCVLKCDTFLNHMMSAEKRMINGVLTYRLCNLIRSLDEGLCGDEGLVPDECVSKLMDSLATAVPMLAEGEQQDSQEIFISMMNSISDEIDKEKSEEEKAVRLPYEGSMRTEVTCCVCGTRASREEVFLALSIPVEDTVTAGLKKLFEESVLSGKYQYACEVCFKNLPRSEQKKLNAETKKKNEESKKIKPHADTKSLDCVYRDAHVRTVISKFNGTLALHLLRFHFQDCTFHKSVKDVTFEPFLDISQYVTEEVGNAYRKTRRRVEGLEFNSNAPHSLRLQLVGIVAHRGSLHGGHYVAYVRSRTKPSSWFFCDDDEVFTVDEKLVFSLKQEVYLLFYDQPWS
uniref:WGS project CAEQ00000000 data, annotated contig 82 n=1 Tax=Trypanosoma congolense (strain IL3000) TaxID=1068625 RepID=F9WIS6_TRYCI|nr:unnamed protein product [Trypanosoma congolense IL3000]